MMTIPGAKLLFGGDVVTEPHSIPSCYGSWKPTAIQVPIREFLKPEHFSICTTEIFGPLQVVVEWGDEDLDALLVALEHTEAYLTAAIVSKDIQFQNKVIEMRMWWGADFDDCSQVIGRTINGTTYSGIRARTTGAPQNHWFGPAGDPR